MRVAGKRKRKIAVWLVAASVLAISLGLAAFGPLWSRLRSPGNPLDVGIAAYERHDWGEAARLDRARLTIKRDDADASRLLARAASSPQRSRFTRAWATRAWPPKISICWAGN